MKKLRRYSLYLLSTAIVLGTLVLSVLFGVGLFQPSPKVDAASANAVNPQQLSALTILPLRPAWDQMTNMTTATPALPACLKSAKAPKCFNPQQMRNAYDVQLLLDAKITGKGRTITLIEEFQDPTIQTDLQLFDRLFGLPDPQLKVLTPFGTTPFNAKDPNHVGFAVETALDVEWAHAMAPDATIVVVQGNPKDESGKGQLTALFQAAQFAVQKNIGDVISMSFGNSEQCLGTALIKQAHAIFQQARAQQQTVLASAGDSGSAARQCDAQGNVVTAVQGLSYPASDPLITSVGGTALTTDATGAYQSETTWNDSNRGSGATGGGFSSIFAEPDYQQRDIQSKTRAVSDLAFDASPLTGALVVTGSAKPGQTLLVPVGGTSLGAPAVAGIIALFDQANGKRLGFINNALYRISDNASAYALTFHDIMSGDNSVSFRANNNQILHVAGFHAGPGWDPGTGVGTPDAARLSIALPQFIQAKDGSKL